MKSKEILKCCTDDHTLYTYQNFIKFHALLWLKKTLVWSQRYDPTQHRFSRYNCRDLSYTDVCP